MIGSGSDGDGDSADDLRAAEMKASGHMGATSEFLAPKATFFNILYSHPLLGSSMLRLAQPCEMSLHLTHDRPHRSAAMG